MEPKRASKSASGQYVLGPDGKTPEPCEDAAKWAAWRRRAREDGSLVVRKTAEGGVEISTVFLGLDHDFFGAGAPVLFETLIRGGEYDQWQNRYTSRVLAEVGHAFAVAMVKHGTVTIAAEPEPRACATGDVEFTIDGVSFKGSLSDVLYARWREEPRVEPKKEETLTEVATRLYAEMASKTTAEQIKNFLGMLQATPVVSAPVSLVFTGLPPRGPDETDEEYADRVNRWLSGAA